MSAAGLHHPYVSGLTSPSCCHLLVHFPQIKRPGDVWYGDDQSDWPRALLFKGSAARLVTSKDINMNSGDSSVIIAQRRLFLLLMGSCCIKGTSRVTKVTSPLSSTVWCCLPSLTVNTATIYFHADKKGCEKSPTAGGAEGPVYAVTSL